MGIRTIKSDTRVHICNTITTYKVYYTIFTAVNYYVSYVELFYMNEFFIQKFVYVLLMFN